MHPLQNERGQAVVAALILLPIVLAISLGGTVLGYALTIEAKAAAACRQSMIKSQKDAAEALKKLLALNTKAESAERKLKAARHLRITARASANPFAIATAETAYLGAFMYREMIAMRQLTLLLKGQTASRMAPNYAEAAIREILPSGITTLKSLSPISESGRFHLIASPPGARTPTYRTAPGFTRSQQTSAHWLLSIRIRGLDFAPKIELGCSATLTKNGGQDWAPRITEDRLLSN